MAAETTNREAGPIASFSRCHSGILSGLDTLARLPDLVIAAEQSRMVALATLSLFDDSVLAHHGDEEGDLFPAVLRSSVAGQERELVEAMIEQLTAEHRQVEELWKRLKPKVKHAAGGSRADLTAAEVELLVTTYRRHAAFEEAEFLPLAREILGRDGNHIAALDLALHLRHAPQPAGYI